MHCLQTTALYWTVCLCGLRLCIRSFDYRRWGLIKNTSVILCIEKARYLLVLCKLCTYILSLLPLPVAQRISCRYKKLIYLVLMLLLKCHFTFSIIFIRCRTSSKAISVLSIDYSMKIIPRIMLFNFITKCIVRSFYLMLRI